MYVKGKYNLTHIKNNLFIINANYRFILDEMYVDALVLTQKSAVNKHSI